MIFNEIHTYLLSTLNCSFSRGHMTSSQKQALIILIEKKGKDKRLLKNWRPISLINVDANIASKALALRIRKVLVSLISSDQRKSVSYLSNIRVGFCFHVKTRYTACVINFSNIVMASYVS